MHYRVKERKKMKRLNKRYEQSKNSIKAQIACPCSTSVCRGCITGDFVTNRNDFVKQFDEHTKLQYKLFV